MSILKRADRARRWAHRPQGSWNSNVSIGGLVWFMLILKVQLFESFLLGLNALYFRNLSNPPKLQTETYLNSQIKMMSSALEAHSHFYTSSLYDDKHVFSVLPIWTFCHRCNVPNDLFLVFKVCIKMSREKMFISLKYLHWPWEVSFNPRLPQLLSSEEHLHRIVSKRSFSHFIHLTWKMQWKTERSAPQMN